MRIGEGWTHATPFGGASQRPRIEIEGRYVSREWWFRRRGDLVDVVFRRPDDGRPRYCAAIAGVVMRGPAGQTRSWSTPQAAVKAIDESVG